MFGGPHQKKGAVKKVPSLTQQSVPLGTGYCADRGSFLTAPSYIGSSAQSLVERGASAIRVWTPAVHKLVVLHDKGARRILSP